MEDGLTRSFAALADPTRRAILARLAKGDATVSELSAPFAISQPAISRHLKVLESAGLIEATIAAQSRPRRLRSDALTEAQNWMASVRDQWIDSFDRLDQFLQSSKEKGQP